MSYLNHISRLIDTCDVCNHTFFFCSFDFICLEFILSFLGFHWITFKMVTQIISPIIDLLKPNGIETTSSAARIHYKWLVSAFLVMGFITTYRVPTFWFCTELWARIWEEQGDSWFLLCYHHTLHYNPKFFWYNFQWFSEVCIPYKYLWQV